jgi:signal transduction histidine kinase
MSALDGQFAAACRAVGFDHDELIVRLSRVTIMEAVAGAALHDLRNPLQAISMAAGVLAGGDVGAPATGRLVSTIVDATRLAEDAAERFEIGVARPSGDLSVPVVALQETVATVQRLTRRFSEKARISTSVQLPSTLAPIRDSEGDMSLVVSHLVLNAYEALADRDSGAVRITAEECDGEVSLAVEDDGPGIPTEIAARIWDPFFTTKPVRIHLGLGLPAARVVAGRLQGNLTLAPSVSGVGARFVVCVPAVSGGGTASGK